MKSASRIQWTEKHGWDDIMNYRCSERNKTDAYILFLGLGYGKHTPKEKPALSLVKELAEKENNKNGKEEPILEQLWVSEHVLWTTAPRLLL